MRQTAIIFFFWSSDTTSTDGGEMADIVFIGITIGFFLIALGYVRVCEKLR